MSGKKHSDYALEERRRRDLEAERRRQEEKRGCQRLRQELAEQARAAEQEVRRLETALQRGRVQAEALQRARLERDSVDSPIADATRHLADLRQLQSAAGAGDSTALARLRDQHSRVLDRAGRNLSELQRAVAQADADLAAEARALAVYTAAVAATRGELRSQESALRELAGLRANFEQQASAGRVSVPQWEAFTTAIERAMRVVAAVPDGPSAANARELAAFHGKLKRVLAEAAAGVASAQRLAVQIAATLEAVGEHGRSSQRHFAAATELLRHLSEPVSETAGESEACLTETLLFERADALERQLALLCSGAPPAVQSQIGALRAALPGLRQNAVADRALAEVEQQLAGLGQFRQQIAAAQSEREEQQARLAALADRLALLRHAEANLQERAGQLNAGVSRLREAAWPDPREVDALSADVAALAEGADELEQRLTERAYVISSAVACLEELGYEVLMEAAPSVPGYQLSPTMATLAGPEGLVVQVRAGLDGKLVEEVIRPVEGDGGDFLTAEEIARYQNMEDIYCEDHLRLHDLLAGRQLKLNRYRYEHTAIEQLRTVRLPEAAHERVRSLRRSERGGAPHRRRQGN